MVAKTILVKGGKNSMIDNRNFEYMLDFSEGYHFSNQQNSKFSKPFNSYIEIKFKR